MEWRADAMSLIRAISPLATIWVRQDDAVDQQHDVVDVALDFAIGWDDGVRSLTIPLFRASLAGAVRVVRWQAVCEASSGPVLFHASITSSISVSWISSWPGVFVR